MRYGRVCGTVTGGMIMWNLIADTSCDLFDFEDQEHQISFKTIPFKISFKEEELVDDEHLDIGHLVDLIDTAKEAGKTACPSPGEWLHYFEQQGQALAFTISQNLSGSYNAAMAGKHMLMERFSDKKVDVIDSGGTGPTNIIIINRVIEWIKAGYDFDRIVELAKDQAKHTHTVFALCSYNNLIKNGRVTPIVGFFAKALKLWGIGTDDGEGRIRLKDSARGNARVIASIIGDMRERRSREDNEIVISHVNNPQLAQQLKDTIVRELGIAAERISIYTTRGLDCFYAERGGVIVGY